MHALHARIRAPHTHLAARRREVDIAAKWALQELLEGGEQGGDGAAPALRMQQAHAAPARVALPDHCCVRSRSSMHWRLCRLHVRSAVGAEVRDRALVHACGAPEHPSALHITAASEMQCIAPEHCSAAMWHAQGAMLHAMPAVSANAGW
jgi:hypothetical protein